MRGLIFLAERINRGEKQGGQELIGGLDVNVKRNFFGSQIDSFETSLPCDVPGDESDDPNFRAIFIRAPAILSAGEGVTVMARYDLPEAKKAELAEDAKVDSIIVAVKQGQLMATSFHPEITPTTGGTRLRQDGRGVRPYAGFDISAKSKAEERDRAVKPGAPHLQGHGRRRESVRGGVTETSRVFYVDLSRASASVAFHDGIISHGPWYRAGPRPRASLDTPRAAPRDLTSSSDGTELAPHLTAPDAPPSSTSPPFSKPP